MMIILIFRVGFNSSKTRWFSHTGSVSHIFMSNCNLKIFHKNRCWLYYSILCYARENGEKKLAWFVSFQNCFTKVFEDRKIPSIRHIQILNGIWTVQKQFWCSKAKIITRSVSPLKLGIFWGEKSKVEDRHKASSSSSTVPTILLMDVRECNLSIALRTQPLLN